MIVAGSTSTRCAANGADRYANLITAFVLIATGALIFTHVI